MPIQFHPLRGTLVLVDFNQGFKKPEMVKRRICVVVSPPIENRIGLCTVVPLSTTPPKPVMPYHYELEIPFQLPAKFRTQKKWVKADMICAVGFHRTSLILLGKDMSGKRQYQLNTLSSVHMEKISGCIQASLGIKNLDK